MSGRRPFTDLTKGFSPERRARVAAKAAALREEMTLEELRKSRALSQEDIAASLSVRQPAVAKLEKRDDMHVSNLRRYVEALGGKLEISAHFDDAEVAISNFGTLPPKSGLPAIKHHFVPKFLMNPWVVQTGTGQRSLMGYYWDERQRRVRCKIRGLDSFCYQIDLLSLRHHQLGIDAIERVFFGEIDSKGATAVTALLNKGARELSPQQRVEFVRLLLSLEARRPQVVDLLKQDGAKKLAEGLDEDPEIVDEMKKIGLDESPSSYFRRRAGVAFEDRALAIVQKLVDDPNVGGRVLNAHWHVKTLGEHDGTLVLSDRPLIRVRGVEHPGALWVLPLTPKAAFVAANHTENIRRIIDVPSARFAKELNASSVQQAERFVFSVLPNSAQWLEKRLRRRFAML
ncbi:MAG: DUF4238 domain-containing protein [Reyranella sp.]|nr:DUF4238 domain-containing protein [Reyranella sp.]